MYWVSRVSLSSHITQKRSSTFLFALAPLERLELPTRGVETRCSNSTELKRYVVGRGRVERPSSVFQTDTPTVYVICPYVWREVLESNQFKAGCSRSHSRPDHFPNKMVFSFNFRLHDLLVNTEPL